MASGHHGLFAKRLYHTIISSYDMKKSRVTITLSEDLLQELDKVVRRRQAEQVKEGQLVSVSRSQVIEEVLLQGLKKR